MKKEVVIGMEVKKENYIATSILYMMISIFCAVTLGPLCISFIGVDSFGLVIGIYVAIALLVFMCFANSKVGANAKLVFNEKGIAYYEKDSTGSSLMQILLGKAEDKRYPVMEIPLNNIESVRLNYQIIGRTLSASFMGRKLLIYVKKKSGGEIQVVPEKLISGDGDFLRAIELLEELGIKIIDRNHLKAGLGKDNIAFAEYIKKNVEKGKDPFLTGV